MIPLALKQEIQKQMFLAALPVVIASGFVDVITVHLWACLVLVVLVAAVNTVIEWEKGNG